MLPLLCGGCGQGLLVSVGMAGPACITTPGGTRIPRCRQAPRAPAAARGLRPSSPGKATGVCSGRDPGCGFLSS